MMEDNTLLTGIVKDAEAEAERILAQAEKQVAQRKTAVETQIRALETVSEKTMAQYKELAGRRSGSVINTEERRISLKAREDLSRRVIAEAKKHLSQEVDDPGYSDVLVRWIAEGVLGVNQTEVAVRCSFKETLTDEILKKAEELVKNSTGQTVKITVLIDDPLSEQGVMVSSIDGKVSFNNQVSTRLRRYDQEIKRIISEAITQ